MRHVNAEVLCQDRHNDTESLAFHECMCNFDYRNAKVSLKAKKFKHCILADDMRKLQNFELYVIIAVVVGFVVIFGCAIFCSCKWYFHTRASPCSCCSSSSVCGKRNKKRKNSNKVGEGDGPKEGAPSEETVLPPQTLKAENGFIVHEAITCGQDIGEPDANCCMKFCLSDPVQDCCEFFDCDILWRKKSKYVIPIFGKRKQHPPLQRRPTRPAPPPPKPVIPPVVKNPVPIIVGEIECEPVPEAPPSPEPVRADQPRAMYVDPLSFLQKPFLKSSKEKNSEDEPEALYSRVKGFVLGKVKKSASLASLSRFGGGVSLNPEGSSEEDAKKKKRQSKTVSMASLQNLTEIDFDKGYSSKRTLSLASLNLECSFSPESHEPNDMMCPGNRLSIQSNDSMPPSIQKDEYIDLEEMSKRLAAKMQAEHPDGSSMPASTPKKELKPPSSSSWTPNFIPASVFAQKEDNHQAALSRQLPSASQDSGGYADQSAYVLNPHYYPPVPASKGKPAVPARTAVGTPVYTISQCGTLGRSKPAVPPRPCGASSGNPSQHSSSTLVSSPGRDKTNLPNLQTQPVPRSPRPVGVVKPSGPPPPPPVGGAPIESSI